MVLVQAADGESQDKLQSVRNALDALPVVTSSSEKDHHYPMVASLLFKRTKLNKLLVQFAYDVNTFSGQPSRQHRNVNSGPW